MTSEPAKGKRHRPPTASMRREQALKFQASLAAAAASASSSFSSNRGSANEETLPASSENASASISSAEEAPPPQPTPISGAPEDPLLLISYEYHIACKIWCFIE